MKTNIPKEKDFFGAVGCKLLCANFENLLTRRWWFRGPRQDGHSGTGELVVQPSPIPPHLAVMSGKCFFALWSADVNVMMVSLTTDESDDPSCPSLAPRENPSHEPLYDPTSWSSKSKGLSSLVLVQCGRRELRCDLER